MTVNELGAKLKEVYENAPKNEKTLYLLLFGIEFADEIEKNELTATRLCKIAGIGKLGPVLSLGIKASRDVERKCSK